MYKSKLQEFCQRHRWELPKYAAAKYGPDHMPKFTATVNVHDELFKTPGSYKSIKDAQNTAARVAFDHLAVTFVPRPQPPPSLPLEKTVNDPTMVKGITDYNSRLGTFETYTYDVEFFSDIIFTVVTVDSAAVMQWISDVMVGQDGRLIVGLDTEWGHIPAKGSNQPVATLQLCVGNRCLIYQILCSPLIPSSLADFLSNTNCCFVGVGVKQDIDKLQKEYGIGGDACYVDLREVAADGYGLTELKNAGLKRLVKLVLGKEMEKPRHVTMSWWDERRLTLEQVRYACLDAFVSFEIGRVLMNGVIEES